MPGEETPESARQRTAKEAEITQKQYESFWRQQRLLGMTDREIRALWTQMQINAQNRAEEAANERARYELFENVEKQEPAANQISARTFPWPNIFEVIPIHTPGTLREWVAAHPSELRARRNDIRRINLLYKRAQRELADASAEALMVRVLELAGTFHSEMMGYLMKLTSGLDPQQAEAYADFVYAYALSAGQNYKALAGFGREIGTSLQESLSGAHHSRYEASTLRATTRNLVLDANVRVWPDVAALLPEVLRAVDAHVSNSGPWKEAFPDEMLRVAKTRAAKEISRLAEIPEWQRALELREGLGFGLGKNHDDLYIRDRNGFAIIRRARKDGSITLKRRAAAVNAHWEHCLRAIAEQASTDFRLVSLNKSQGGAWTVNTKAGPIRLTKKEVASLKEGRALAEEHRLSQLLTTSEEPVVIYSSPLMGKAGQYRVDVDSLAFALQRSYPSAKVYRDELTATTRQHKKDLQARTITAPKEIVVVTDAGSFFDVDDRGIINDILLDLRDASVRTIEFVPGVAWTDGEGQAVLVISGHIDERLAEFVRALGNAGFFKGNIVVLNTCYAEMSSQLVAEVQQRYGAVATYRYEGEIRPDAVQDIIMSFTEQLGREDCVDVDFEWSHRVRGFGHNGIWTICENTGDSATWLR